MDLNISLPKSWSEINNKQYRDFLKTCSTENIDMEEAIALLALKWARLTVAGRSGDNSNFLLKSNQGTAVEVSKEELHAITMHLGFLKSIPPTHLRPTVIGRRPARSHSLHDLSFASYIAVDNFINAYLNHKKTEAIDKAAALLTKFQAVPLSMSKCDRAAVLYWWIAFKNNCAQLFPDFLKHSQQNSGDLLKAPPSARESADAMIRALTKGNIAREIEILKAPALRALTELNALARENDELKRKLKSSN